MDKAIEIIDLNENQAEELDELLSKFDGNYIGFKLEGDVCVGIVKDGTLIAGASGCMTAFKIFYVSTLFVDENHRKKGLGRKIMEDIEEKAKALGANMIRLDTFNWQGPEFYKKLGYEQVGFYESKEDNFSEYFFIKRLGVV